MPKGHPKEAYVRKFEPFIEKALTFLHESGMNDTEIADELGVSTHTVYVWRTGYGCTRITAADYVAKQANKMAERRIFAINRMYNEVQDDAISVGIGKR